MINSQLILTTLQQCDALIRQFGEIPPLLSVRNQLLYLQDLAEGRTTDKSRLKDIILGVQAARELEKLDEKMAENIYMIMSQVRLISSIDVLWLALDRALHAPRPGESLQDRLRAPAWEHDDPVVQAAWEKLTRPENFPALEAWAKMDMNPMAQNATEAALRIARSRSRKGL